MKLIKLSEDVHPKVMDAIREITAHAISTLKSGGIEFTTSDIKPAYYGRSHAWTIGMTALLDKQYEMWVNLYGEIGLAPKGVYNATPPSNWYSIEMVVNSIKSRVKKKQQFVNKPGINKVISKLIETEASYNIKLIEKSKDLEFHDEDVFGDNSKIYDSRTIDGLAGDVARKGYKDRISIDGFKIKMTVFGLDSYSQEFKVDIGSDITNAAKNRNNHDHYVYILKDGLYSGNHDTIKQKITSPQEADLTNWWSRASKLFASKLQKYETH